MTQLAQIETFDKLEKVILTDDVVKDLQSEVLTWEQASCPVNHRFSEGLYIRELRMMAGTFAIGHKQRFKHLNIFIQGKVLIYTKDGQKEIQAPMTFEGEPGQKVGLILEDMLWQNVYPNPDNERDIDKLEERWLDKTEAPNLIEENRSEDQEDFASVIEELGYTPERVWEESCIEDDMIPFPVGYDVRISVRGSAIHGKGLFSNSGFDEGEVIAPASLDGKRTPAGRYTNHGKHPNARFKRLSNGAIYLVASRDIAGCFGGGKGEEITISYKQAQEVRQA